MQDELLWGASWLHRASNNVSFMSYVQAYGMQLGAGDDDYSFSWDDKRVGTKILLSKGFLRNRLQGLQLYKAHSDNYICSLVPGTSTFQAQYTPGTLVNINYLLILCLAFLLSDYILIQELHLFKIAGIETGGLIYKEGDSNMQYVTTATFVLLAYAKYLRSSGASVSCGSKDVSPAELVALAKRQASSSIASNAQHSIAICSNFHERVESTHF